MDRFKLAVWLAHLLLQVRTRTLNGTLRQTFQRWWPAMTPVSAPTLS